MAEQQFAIFTPKYGLAENVPKILLSEAFIAQNSDNVHEIYGEYRKIPGRYGLFFDDDGNKIACPVYVHAITGVNVSGKKFTISGNHATDLSSYTSIRVNGSTGNDKLYTVSTITDVGGNTEIVVGETVADGTVDGNIFAGSTNALCYHLYKKESTGTEYLLVGTAYHVLLWNDMAKTLTVKFTSGTPASVERMEMVTHLDNVYMTNNVDKVQWWNCEDSIGNDFENVSGASGIDLGGSSYITAAKHICTFETYLILGYITLSDSSIHPQRIDWSSRGTGGSTIDFDRTGTGDTNYKIFVNEPSFLIGFGRKGSDLIVAKKGRLYRGWLTTQDTVFEWKEEDLKVGCLSADTLVNDKAGRLYFLASDLTIRELDTTEPISTLVDVTLRRLNCDAAEFAQATYIDEFGEIWFALPTGVGDDNNTIVGYNANSGSVFTASMAVRAFGIYNRQTVYSYDSLPYDTYAEWGAAWGKYDTNRNALGFAMNIGADYSGNTFELNAVNADDGSDWTGTIILSTSLTTKKSLHLYKHVPNGCDLYFNRKSVGSASLYGRTDTQKGWTELGSASFVDSVDQPDIVTVHVPFNVRGRTFYFKIESADQMEFIGMMFRELFFDGDR